MIYIKVLFFLAHPQRNHVYHITFPPEWKTIDITNVLSPFSKFYNPLLICVNVIFYSIVYS